MKKTVKNYLYSPLLVLFTLGSQVVQVNAQFKLASALLTFGFILLSYEVAINFKPFPKYRKWVLAYVFLSLVAMVYGINSDETENFLFIANFIKLTANQIIVIILIVLSKVTSESKTQVKQWVLLSIFIGGLSFIFLFVQNFEFSTQLIALARITQFAVIVFYGLFRKNLSKYISLYIIATFVGESIAAARIAGFTINYSYFLQNSILLLGIYFIYIGVLKTLNTKK